MIVSILVLIPTALIGLVAPRLRAHINILVFRTWARFCLWVLGVRLTVKGTPPQAPFLLVSNHLSYIDILALSSQLDGVFVAKSEIARWPVIGLACKLVRTVFVDRETKRSLPRVLAEIDDRLAYGQGVIFFPEGTSSGGAEVAPFRPPLLEAAAQSGHPVHYASLAYRTLPGENPAHLAVCWWRKMTLPDHLFRLASMPGFEASLAFGGEPVHDHDRKELARRLHHEVVGLFEPTMPHAIAEKV